MKASEAQYIARLNQFLDTPTALEQALTWVKYNSARGEFHVTWMGEKPPRDLEGLTACLRDLGYRVERKGVIYKISWDLGDQHE